MRLVEIITGARCSGKQTFAFCLDVEQAFDRVWNEGLIHKLREILLPDCYGHLIARFLRIRNFCARVDGHFSSERTISAGVPQGSVLRPLLFSVYVNDVPRHPGVELCIFADYKATYTVDRNADSAVPKLRRQLDTYVDWADKWRIAVNASESTAVVFTKRIKLPRQRLRVGRTYLPWAKIVKGFTWIDATQTT